MFMCINDIRKLLIISAVALSFLGCGDEVQLVRDSPHWKTVEVLNGTWYPDKWLPDGGFSKIPVARVFLTHFSWGIGKTLTDTSLNIDLGAMKIFMPFLAGLYTIERITKSRLRYTLFLFRPDPAFPDQHHVWKVTIRVVDKGKLLIHCGREYDKITGIYFSRIGGP